MFFFLKKKDSIVFRPRPPYVLPAYTWLLHNLHNPYPSSKVKTSLASKTGSPRKDIDDWFIDVRKRIGWTALCKSEFSNKRSSIIAAAIQFFKGSRNNSTFKDATNTSGLIHETYFTHFARISNCAESLYPDLMTSISTSPSYGSRFENITLTKKYHQSCNKVVRGRSRSQTQVANPYFSPSSSPSSSRNNSPSPPQDIQSPMCYEKRQRSESCESTDRGSSQKPQKRGRLVVFLPIRMSSIVFWLNYRYISESSAIKSLPSPPASPPDTSSPDDEEISTLPTLRKRKRCLSDTDDRMPKRLHSVSTPPYPIHTPGIFGTKIPEFGLEFPNPVTAQNFDDNSPVELEYFQYDFSPHFSEVQPSEAPLMNERCTPNITSRVLLDINGHTFFCNPRVLP